MVRGQLTENINKIAKKHIGREITQEELRLIPYIQYIMVNEQKIDPRRINADDRVIIEKWKQKGYMDGTKPRLTITKEFWNFMCDILFESYVLNAHEDVK